MAIMCAKFQINQVVLALFSENLGLNSPLPARSGAKRNMSLATGLRI